MKKDIGIERYLIRHYSEMLTKNPRSLLFLPLANSFKMRGNPEIAIEICQNGLKHHPNCTSGRALLGELYFICKRYKEAAKELKIVTQSDPENIVAKSLLIEIYLNNGLAAEAAEMGKELAEICSVGNSLDYVRRDIKKHINPYQRRRRQDTQGGQITPPAKDTEVGGSREADDHLIDDSPAFKEIRTLFSEKKRRPPIFENISSEIHEEKD